ncbi:Glycine--tRNA ligase [Durusdinium trenchii]
MGSVLGCHCSDEADQTTEATAENDVVPISTVPAPNPGKETAPAKTPSKETSGKNRMQDAQKKLQTCARALRNRMAKEQSDVWKKAEAEFNVQKMIWQSLSLQRGEKHQGTAAMIQSKLEFAVQSHTSNLPAAVEALDVCLEKNQGHDLLGAAMVESIEAIKTAAVHADARAELANLLEKAAEELAVGQCSKKGADTLMQLLGDSGIQEPKLEAAIKSAWTFAYGE